MHIKRYNIALLIITLLFIIIYYKNDYKWSNFVQLDINVVCSGF